MNAKVTSTLFRSATPGLIAAIMLLSTSYFMPLNNSYENHKAFAQSASNMTSSTNNTNARTIPSTTTTTAANANSSSALGTIASLQNNSTGKPTWILSGQWQLMVPKPLKVSQTNPPTAAAFDASFRMVKIDGTEMHTHTISDFKLTKFSINKSSTTYNGTATITLKDGLHNNVPIGVTIMHQGSMSLWIDPTKVNNHFGNTPIYGTVSIIGVFLSLP
jgi:hypothetical protein